MKFLIILSVFLSINSCASENISNKDTNMTKKENSKLNLTVDNKIIGLEFFNIKYTTVDEKCLIRKIHKFDGMIKKHNYGMQKHKPHWRYPPFSSRQSPWDEKMILLKAPKNDFSLIMIKGIEPPKKFKEYYKDKKNMELYLKNRKKPSFYKLLTSPTKMKDGDRFLTGWSNEEIDFEACFK